MISVPGLLLHCLCEMLKSSASAELGGGAQTSSWVFMTDSDTESAVCYRTHATLEDEPGHGEESSRKMGKRAEPRRQKLAWRVVDILK